MIIAAAIKQGEIIHSLPRPARHHDIIREMVNNGYPKPIKGEQGFIALFDKVAKIYEADSLRCPNCQIIRG